MRLLGRGEASSLYGAIIMSLILAIFVSIYSAALANISRQGEVYREAVRGYFEAYSEDLDLYWNKSSSSIYAYSSSGARVVYIVIGDGESIAMAMNTSIQIPPGSREEVLTASQSRLAASSSSFVAVFTDRGRVYIYRWGGAGGAGEVYAIPGAVKGIYYAVSVGASSYIAFYYNQSGGRVDIATYRWDIDRGYIIFESPIDGTIYLERVSAILNTLNTTGWFNPPSVAYQKPRISISFPPPWSVTRNHDIYYVFMNTTSYSYNPAAGVEVGRSIAIAPLSSWGSVSVKAYLSQGGSYYAGWSATDLPEGWRIDMAMNRLLPGDLGIVGAGGIDCYWQVPYFAYRGKYSAWVAQIAVYDSGASFFRISLGPQTIYIPVDNQCRVAAIDPGAPVHTWLYGFTVQGPLKIYSNSTIYAKQGGIVIASNGNKIYFIDNLSSFNSTLDRPNRS